jgi:hypothetical protein
VIARCTDLEPVRRRPEQAIAISVFASGRGHH